MEVFLEGKKICSPAIDYYSAPNHCISCICNPSGKICNYIFHELLSRPIWDGKEISLVSLTLMGHFLGYTWLWTQDLMKCRESNPSGPQARQTLSHSSCCTIPLAPQEGPLSKKKHIFSKALGCGVWRQAAFLTWGFDRVGGILSHSSYEVGWPHLVQQSQTWAWATRHSCLDLNCCPGSTTFTQPFTAAQLKNHMLDEANDLH